ncbi:AraC family transcriptional regulator [Pseudomonas putida]
MPSMLRSSSLTNFVEVALAVGLDPYRQLRNAGISNSALMDPNIMILAKSVMRLLEDSAHAAGIEDFGLRMGQSRQLENLGPLAVALREEQTLRNAWQSLIRRLGLTNGSMVLRIEEAGDVAIFRQDVTDNMDGSVRQATELVACVITRTLKQLLGPAWKPHSVCFTHSAPVNVAMHRQVFGSSPRFNHEFDGIVLARADLDAPIQSYDPLIARHAREFLDTKLAQADFTMPDKVRQLVFALLPTGECVAEKVAEQLRVDRKTMYRHLANHNQSYSSIVDEVRVSLVNRYIENRERSLSEIATLLGFSALSAFSRWFSGRFGCSVSTWRREKLRS